MLQKILLGFGVLSNFATLLGLWIAYISTPETVQNRIGHVLLIAGASVSVALYLIVAWVIQRQPSPEKTKTSPDIPLRIFVSSPGISFRLMQDRGKAALDLIFTTNATIELNHIKVYASSRKQELCEFTDSAPIQLVMGQHQKRVEATITPQAVAEIALGSVMSLRGTATFRQGTELKYEPINMTTVVLVEDFTSVAAAPV